MPGTGNCTSSQGPPGHTAAQTRYQSQGPKPPSPPSLEKPLCPGMARPLPAAQEVEVLEGVLGVMQMWRAWQKGCGVFQQHPPEAPTDLTASQPPGKKTVQPARDQLQSRMSRAADCPSLQRKVGAWVCVRRSRAVFHIRKEVLLIYKPQAPWGNILGSPKTGGHCLQLLEKSPNSKSSPQPLK